MGIIYLITNTVDGKQYVGQTTRSLDIRFKEHIDAAAHYARYIANPDKYVWKGTCTYLYRAMTKYGIDKFIVEELDATDDVSLDSLEIEYIDRLCTLAPNGYNLTTGGERFNHCDATRRRISDTVKTVMLSDIDRFRTSAHTKGMPPYIAYKQTDTYRAYYVNNHPKCTRKYFSASTYGSIEIAKQACVDYVTTLNECDEPAPAEPIKGIRKQRNGYRVRKIISGHSYEKSFTDKTKSDNENYQNAVDYIESLQQE